MQNGGLTAFGKDIKKRLVDIEQTQNWLIEQVAKRTGLYFDRSYMYKIKSGRSDNPKIVHAIREILELPDEDRDVG